jgi:sec-independent protein translocase protein TatA
MPGGPELYIILIVVVLLFGGSQLPKLARSLGEAKREFERSQGDAASGATVEKTEKVEKTETKAKRAETDDEG